MDAAAITSDIEAIEDAFVTHWSQFGRGPGGVYHDDGDLIWIEAPIPQLPYNAVLRTRLLHDIDDRIATVTAHYRARNVNFMWLAFPTAEPGDLDRRLATYGMELVESGTGMSLDLHSWASQRTAPAPNQDGSIVYREVDSEAGMDAWELLMAYYWELPPQSRLYAYGINRWVGYGQKAPGFRWVAYMDGEPVGKAYLSLLGSPDSGAIFGVSVCREARGRGVATVLTEHLLQRAHELGRRRVVLHSSEMAANLYRRIGFVDRCALPVYATNKLHSLQTS